MITFTALPFRGRLVTSAALNDFLTTAVIADLNGNDFANSKIYCTAACLHKRFNFNKNLFNILYKFLSLFYLEMT